MTWAAPLVWHYISWLSPTTTTTAEVVQKRWRFIRKEDSPDNSISCVNWHNIFQFWAICWGDISASSKVPTGLPARGTSQLPEEAIWSIRRCRFFQKSGIRLSPKCQQGTPADFRYTSYLVWSSLSFWQSPRTLNLQAFSGKQSIDGQVPG